MQLYECKSCGMVATERHTRCPACKSTSGTPHGGTVYRRLPYDSLQEYFSEGM